MKLNRTDKQTLFAILVVIVLITVLGSLRQSNYQPREISIATKNEESLFNIQASEKCLGSYYSNSVGGICDGQKLVKDQADAEITDGIGGTLI
tara:strand:+ start:1205 stop:1483 length:279 start_codon:yes stop_codon:yes gene_type:complete